MENILVSKSIIMQTKKKINKIKYRIMDLPKLLQSGFVRVDKNGYLRVDKRSKLVLLNPCMLFDLESGDIIL